GLIAWQPSPTSGAFSPPLAITNLGDPISHWTLTFTMPGGQAATTGWNATFTIGAPVTASDAGWNGAIRARGTNGAAGMEGTWSRRSPGSAPPSPFPLPTDFTLNGVRCTGSATGGNQ